MPAPLVTMRAPVVGLMLTFAPLTRRLPVKLFCCPAALTLPPIPAPPNTTRAPLLLAVLALVLLMVTF